MIYVSFSVILVACCNLMPQKLDSISQKYLIFIRFFSVTKIMSGCLSFFAIWLISCKWKKSKHSWSRKTSVRFQSLPWALLVKQKLYDQKTLLTDRHISWLFKIQEAQLYMDSAHQILEPENDTGLTVLVIFLHKRNTEMPSCVFIPCRRLRTGTSFACPTDNCWFCSLKSYQFLLIFHE